MIVYYLINIELGNGVESIGSYVFYSCDRLESVIIGGSVESIGSYAFTFCSRLTIFCEEESKPSGWDSDWNYDNRPVVWGYKG